MLVPIAAVLLAFGAYQAPSTVTAEPHDLTQYPGIQVQDIRAASVTAQAPEHSMVGW